MKKLNFQFGFNLNPGHMYTLSTDKDDYTKLYWTALL